MPARKQDTVSVACPKCGHTQQEPRSAYSTRCKKCHEHFRLEEALHPVAPVQKPSIPTRRVQCFQCGTELEAPTAATSTMCKRCSSHLDLSDHQIAHTVSKNYRTYGRLVVEEKGYLLNTEALVGEAVLKGRVIGKVHATRILEIHTSARLQGTIAGGVLVIPHGHHFAWKEVMRLTGAEIGGELSANLHATGTVTLKASSRFFGNVEAGNLVVEPGAVFVGNAKVGVSQPDHLIKR
jgi:cytoskeletal protein CcmA (bactofilin family)/DNA-directed RNA polymerase subunit RPC12/RpoP